LPAFDAPVARKLLLFTSPAEGGGVWGHYLPLLLSGLVLVASSFVVWGHPILVKNYCIDWHTRDTDMDACAAIKLAFFAFIGMLCATFCCINFVFASSLVKPAKSLPPKQSAATPKVGC
jgi:hypothetical protein